jgi:hypothetical protein
VTIYQQISSQYVRSIGTALIIFADVKCASSNKINGPKEKRCGRKVPDAKEENEACILHPTACLAEVYPVLCIGGTIKLKTFGTSQQN